MQLLNVSSGLPIYLPYDTAAVPFGDPISDISVTSSTTGVVTAPGYAPVLNDAVQFSASGAGSAVPGGITAFKTYYVIAPSGDTFSISTAKGGSAVATTDTGAGLLTLHLVSGEVDGVVIPFKPGNTAVALNIGATNLTLQGASDTNVTTYGDPQGPDSWNTIATVNSGTAKLVQLSYDWIRVTSSGTLVLLQN
jgi:hypothetical protein